MDTGGSYSKWRWASASHFAPDKPRRWTSLLASEYEEDSDKAERNTNVPRREEWSEWSFLTDAEVDERARIDTTYVRFDSSPVLVIVAFVKPNKGRTFFRFIQKYTEYYSKRYEVDIEEK